MCKPEYLPVKRNVYPMNCIIIYISSLRYYPLLYKKIKTHRKYIAIKRTSCSKYICKKEKVLYSRNMYVLNSLVKNDICTIFLNNNTTI